MAGGDPQTRRPDGRRATARPVRDRIAGRSVRIIGRNVRNGRPAQFAHRGARRCGADARRGPGRGLGALGAGLAGRGHAAGPGHGLPRDAQEERARGARHGELEGWHAGAEHLRLATPRHSSRDGREGWPDAGRGTDAAHAQCGASDHPPRACCRKPPWSRTMIRPPYASPFRPPRLATPAKPAPAAGFSLLEVMIAVAVLGLIGGLTWKSFDAASDLKSRTERAEERDQTVRGAMNRIAREVSMTFLSEHYDHKRFRERPTRFVLKDGR
ncbi:MAG: prepilin-type N-terminal cleavage/methylation domain-containing protein, partial [Deltaproteobacteria bacterium]